VRRSARRDDASGESFVRDNLEIQIRPAFTGRASTPDALRSCAVSERMRRVDESVREVVAEGVRQLKDPRIGMVTVTGVRVTADLREATVYVSVLGGARRREASLAGLESAHGVLQARINRELTLRRTPHLTFEYDETVERGVRMTKLIDELAAELPPTGEHDEREPDDREPDDSARE
jgi:ribosome-binding factor A